MGKALETAKTFIGKVINNDIVIIDVYQEPKQKVKATYKCSCGNLVYNSKFDRLLRGETVRCKICATTANSNSPKKQAKLRANAKYGYLVGKTINHFKVLRWATREETKHTGKFVCQCVCGNIRMVAGNELVTRKDRKSCGCLARQLQSLTNGGTGIPYENATVQRALRDVPEYAKWVKACLEKAKYTCMVSGIKRGHLAVHHLIPFSHLIKLYSLTLSNYKLYLNELFDINNGVVLQKTIHTKLHQIYGIEVSIPNIIEYRDTNYPKI